MRGITAMDVMLIMLVFQTLYAIVTEAPTFAPLFTGSNKTELYSTQIMNQSELNKTIRGINESLQPPSGWTSLTEGPAFLYHSIQFLKVVVRVAVKSVFGLPFIIHDFASQVFPKDIVMQLSLAGLMINFIVLYETASKVFGGGK